MSMPTETELIAQQALKIANLEAEVARMTEDREAIQRIIYCIGGPLNDNKLGFTREQMAVFQRIADHSSD